MPTPNFYRVGNPVRVPVSMITAATPFPLTFTAEQNAIPDLAFIFINPNKFDVMLEGTPAGQAFTVANPGMGWPILARTVAMGPFTSKRPDRLSAVAWDNPENPIPSGQVWTDRYLILMYGRGA